MKLFLFAGVAVLLLGGAGAGAYFFLLAPEAADAAISEKQDIEQTDKDSHGGAHLAYIEMQPLLIPIMDDYGVTQTIKLNIAIEVTDESIAPTIEALKPKLSDAFLQDIYGVLNRHASYEKQRVIHEKYVEQRLHNVTQKVLGNPKAVNGVLLKMVEQNPV